LRLRLRLEGSLELGELEMEIDLFVIGTGVRGTPGVLVARDGLSAQVLSVEDLDIYDFAWPRSRNTLMQSLQ
jgi:hypothetical protein